MNNKPAKVLSFTISARIETEPTKTVMNNNKKKLLTTKSKNKKFMYL